jgi:aminoglycoside phosphotransferase (APT) family kinase protein
MTFQNPTNQENRALYEGYLSKSLDKSIELVGASQLTGGFRNTLWRLDIKTNDSSTSLVLRSLRTRAEELVNEAYPHNLALEFETLEKVRQIGLPTPKVWGLDEEGKALGVPCFLMEFIDGMVLRERLSNRTKLFQYSD